MEVTITPHESERTAIITWDRNAWQMIEDYSIDRTVSHADALHALLMLGLDGLKGATNPKVTLAQARLEAAESRQRAANQAEQAASYYRQAKKPAYEGQAEIRTGKGDTVSALAITSRARADLIEAEAEAAYRAATGQEPPTGQKTQ